MYNTGMAHLHKKKKNGSVYYYLREMQRVNGKPKVIWQKYLGTADTMHKKLLENESTGKPEKVKTFSFGAIFLLNELEKK
ncbi:transposase, partial [Candidatus Fermentibacteria bacterium]